MAEPSVALLIRRRRRNVDEPYCPVCQHLIPREAHRPAPRYCPRCFAHAHRSVRLRPRPAPNVPTASRPRDLLRVTQCETASQFAVTREREGMMLRIAVVGEVDIATAPRLRHECERTHPADIETILLDLTAVTFLDSSGLHALIAAQDHVGERLAILISPACERSLELTGLDRTLPILRADPNAIRQVPNCG